MTTCKLLNASVFTSERNGNAPVARYELASSSGITVHVLTLGACLERVLVPRAGGGAADNVVLSLDAAADYDRWLKGVKYLGVAVGRFANRIAGGKFSLDGAEYALDLNNNGQHHLHGGANGWSTKVWDAKIVDGNKLRLSYTSPDGDQGYPGDVECAVTYSIEGKGALRIDYEAKVTGSKATPLNLTNHTFFNLAGLANKATILEHTVQIAADGYTPVNSALIPTGEIAPVKDTVYDLRTAAVVGDKIKEMDSADECRGFDHNYVLSTDGDLAKEAAVVHDPSSGRTMRVFTTEPGVQLYTSNFLDGSVSMDGHKMGQYAALCLETQHYPDSVNQPSFPSTIYRPGETFKSTTTYAFEF